MIDSRKQKIEKRKQKYLRKSKMQQIIYKYKE